MLLLRLLGGGLLILDIYLGRLGRGRVAEIRRWPACVFLGLLLLPQTPVLPNARQLLPLVSAHPGRKVEGEARHRDPVRSSHRYTAWRWGHKGVALAVLIPFPFAQRPWALPVLVALYRSAEDNRKRGRPHKTPVQLLPVLLRLLLRWFPDRSFHFAGDAGYGSHDRADFARRSQGRLHLVSKFHPRANLYQPPPQVSGKKPNGRPRKK